MKQTMNFTITDDDLGRFSNREDLQQFYRAKGLSGLELMFCGADRLPPLIAPEDVVGVHLKCVPAWYDFWQGDRAALEREYGSEEVWRTFYGGTKPEDLLKPWQQELELAQQCGAEYVVFHVAECTLEECVTYVPHHRDEEVCDAACRIINELLDGKNYDFYFLCENLWWSGLTMTRPEIVQRLMDGIHYGKKGIILDTGHLLHTNNDLETQTEGLAYIHRVLDRLGPLTGYLKAMHLNQSITGAYVKEALAHPMTLTGDYWQRLSQLYPHIFRIDQHRPFSEGPVGELIRRLQPEFVTHEMITRSRRELDEFLTTQLKTIADNP